MVAELADCESAATEPVVLLVLLALDAGTVGAATGLGTIGGATGVAGSFEKRKSINIRFIKKQFLAYISLLAKLSQ